MSEIGIPYELTQEEGRPEWTTIIEAGEGSRLFVKLDSFTIPKGRYENGSYPIETIDPDEWIELELGDMEILEGQPSTVSFGFSEDTIEKFDLNQEGGIIVGNPPILESSVQVTKRQAEKIHNPNRPNPAETPYGSYVPDYPGSHEFGTIIEVRTP